MTQYSIVILANQVTLGQIDSKKERDDIHDSTGYLIENIRTYKDASNKVIVINELYLNSETEEVLLASDFKVLKTNRQTKGALATAALSLDLVNEIDPIIVIPSNSKVDFNIVDFIEKMKIGDCAAGIVTLTSQNPTMSFVRSFKNTIVEIAEKQIIGTEATAGIFFFKNKRVFVEAIGWALVNQVTTNGNFYIAPALNYFLTQRLPIGRYKIEDQQYIRLEE